MTMEEKCEIEWIYDKDKWFHFRFFHSGNLLFSRVKLRYNMCDIWLLGEEQIEHERNNWYFTKLNQNFKILNDYLTENYDFF